MRRIFATAALIFVLLTGCVSDATIRAAPGQLPGTYYSGDGLGRMVTVTLQPDGTYFGDWQGCLVSLRPPHIDAPLIGNYGASASIMRCNRA